MTLALLLTLPAIAPAATVLQLGRDGHVRHARDRFVPASAAPLAPRRPASARPARDSFRPATRRRPRRPAVTVVSTLAHLERTGAITSAAHDEYLREFRSALSTERRLKGTRHTELMAITVNLHEMAAAGTLTASRLPALFLTLTRNQQWWTTGSLLSYGQRVEFAGSPLVWEYYPGQGIQLTVLGNFGKTNAACKAGASGHATCAALLSQLVPLAARRAGGLTWEYYFHFDGGAPPWTSAMSQATALEALAYGYRELGDPALLDVAQRALPVLQKAPPAGVAVPTRRGERFVQYTFAPGGGQEVINAFLQTLIGLNVYAQISGNVVASQLFSAGNAEAVAELPHFDTGAWSLYQPGIEDDLSYHELVTGFLGQLCTMTRAEPYCDTATNFADYVHQPPVVQLLTRRLRQRRTGLVRFDLSKISHVGLVIEQGTHTAFATSARFPYGDHAFAVPGLRRAGQYTVHMSATGPAGNFARFNFRLTVLPAPRQRPCGKAKKRCGSTARRSSRSLRRF